MSKKLRVPDDYSIDSVVMAAVSVSISCPTCPIRDFCDSDANEGTDCGSTWLSFMLDDHGWIAKGEEE